MGEVLHATHIELDHEVAIKLLRPELAKDTSSVERFVREARAAARIVSPHVVRILDVSRDDDGTPYIVMEYLEGEDLSQRVERGPMPYEEAVDYVLQTCLAIAEAHRVGVIHRDLKPANLFLAKRRSGPPIVKVVDFGISKVAPRHGRVEQALTEKDALMGTPFYMAPEQLRGGVGADGRTDVWALGLVAFELMTGGSGPFEAPTLPELCTRIISDRAVRLSEALTDGNFPPGLEDVIDRCLTKDPDGRYQSVEELALALAPYAPHSLALATNERRIGEEITSRFGSSPDTTVDALPKSDPPPSSRGTWAPVTSSATPRPTALVSGRRPRWNAIVSVAVGAMVLGALGIGALKLAVAPHGSDLVATASEPVSPAIQATSAPTQAPLPVATAPSAPPTPAAAASSASTPTRVATTPRRTTPPKHAPATVPHTAPVDEFGGRH